MTRRHAEASRSGKRLADGLFNRRGDGIEAAMEKTQVDRYDQAKQQAAQLAPGSYTMRWQLFKGSVRTSKVIIDNRRGINCFCFEQDVDTPQELFSPVESAMRIGTTFTPEISDDTTKGDSDELLRGLCAVLFVGVHSLS